jgi:subtilisin family serine protease
LLSACGGGSQDVAETGQAAEAAQGAEAAADEALALLRARQFKLYPDNGAAAAQAEQLLLDPAAGANQARLIVRLNPAAVPQGNRAALLSGGSAGQGESGDAAARRAQQLAAKASAVAQASQSVLSRTVLQRAPGAQLRQQFSHALEAFVITVPWSEAQQVADALALDAAVDSVELDRPLQLEQSAEPVRALDARAWGVDRIDQRERSFDRAFRGSHTGSGVSVYVVDTGINPHGQFGTRLRAGFSAINDGRGTRDCQGHGTHVAGTAAGATLGVAPGAQLIPVRVMDCRGSGTSSSLLAGLDWIAAQGSRPGVVNLSLGGPASASVDAAAQRLLTAGYSVVAAAGNSRANACEVSPARAAGVLTVAATDNADMMASYSNWGACVALWAPGSQIASAGIASSTAVVVMSGTSMAAPHAAGAAALVLQAQPAATPEQVRNHLQQQATPDAVQGSPGGTVRGLLYAGTEGPLGAGAPAPVPALPGVRASIASFSSKVPTPGRWSAHAEVLVVNEAGQPVSSARVTGRYSNMSQDVSCTTARTGRCTLNSLQATWGAVPSIGFALNHVAVSRMAYLSDGPERVQLAQPEAPVASVAGITGTMLKASSRLPDWKPRFAPTVRDTRGTAMAQARVEGVITVYSGSRPVAAQALVCTTGSGGQCLLDWKGAYLGAQITGATLQVRNVSRAFMVYQPGPVTEASLGQVR